MHAGMQPHARGLRSQGLSCPRSRHATRGSGLPSLHQAISAKGIPSTRGKTVRQTDQGQDERQETHRLDQKQTRLWAQLQQSSTKTGHSGLIKRHHEAAKPAGQWPGPGDKGWDWVSRETRGGARGASVRDEKPLAGGERKTVQ